MMHHIIAIKENSDQNLHIWPNLTDAQRGILPENLAKINKSIFELMAGIFW